MKDPECSAHNHDGYLGVIKHGETGWTLYEFDQEWVSEPIDISPIIAAFLKLKDKTAAWYCLRCKEPVV